MNDPALILDRLQRALARWLDWKKLGFAKCIDNTEFGDWYEDAKKWLRLGGRRDAPVFEADRVSPFCSTRIVPYGGVRRYDIDDQETYDQSMATMERNLRSAIENLELGISVPEEATERARSGSSKRSGPRVDARGAAQVVVGDGNEVALVRELTLSDLLKKVEIEIDKLPGPQEQKEGLGLNSRAREEPTFSERSRGARWEISSRGMTSS